VARRPAPVVREWLIGVATQLLADAGLIGIARPELVAVLEQKAAAAAPATLRLDPGAPTDSGGSAGRIPRDFRQHHVLRSAARDLRGRGACRPRRLRGYRRQARRDPRRRRRRAESPGPPDPRRLRRCAGAPAPPRDARRGRRRSDRRRRARSRSRLRPRDRVGRPASWRSRAGRSRPQGNLCGAACLRKHRRLVVTARCRRLMHREIPTFALEA
jgi:hypothetical protein